MESNTEKPNNDTAKPPGQTNPILVTNKSIPVKSSPLTTKKSIELLLTGTLKNRVCKSCLNVTPALTSLSQVLEVAKDGVFYKISIKDMIASFHPCYEISEDCKELPNKICNKCLNRTINAYLFNQQYKQSDQALRNCFKDVYENVIVLDPLDKESKPGRRKLHVNYNVIKVTHKYVKDYAKPLIQLVKSGSLIDNSEIVLNKNECPKCWEVLPNLASLIRHEKTHPKAMWFRCRYCGLSFARKVMYNRHIKVHISQSSTQLDQIKKVENKFKCTTCDTISDNYIYHLQHLEKHKFKETLQNILAKKDLCAVCLEDGKDMVNVDKTVALHGGYQDLMGDCSLDTILPSVLPDINPKSFLGSKICKHCLDAALNAYIFKTKSNYSHRRLDKCLSLILDNVKDLKDGDNIFIEISPNLIMPVKEKDIIKDGELAFNEDLDEAKLHSEVLEDKYRIESENDDDDKSKEVFKKHQKRRAKTINRIEKFGKNMDVSEFLTFKTKKVKTKIAKFTCPICNKHFVSDYFLKNHALRHASKKVVCKICNDDFKNRFSLIEHRRMTHILKRSYESCKTCFRAFGSIKLLQKHEQSHRRKQCQLCNKYFKSQRFHDIHLQRHWNKFKICPKANKTCSFCEKQFTNRNDLNVHINKIHLQIKPYDCDMCNSKFYTQLNLKSHKRVHRENTKEKCRFCDKILFSRRSLVIHVRKHMNSKPFNCQICDETFYTGFRRNRHMVEKHGGRFVCIICKTPFAGRKELKTHVGKVHVVKF